MAKRIPTTAPARAPEAACSRALPKGSGGMAAGLAWSHDGRWIAVAVEGETAIRLLDASSGDQQSAIAVPGDIWDLAFALDGTRLVVACDEVISVDVATARPTARAPLPRENVPGSLAVSPDGRRVAIGGDALSLLDASDLALQATLTKDKWGVTFPAWSPDGLLVGAFRGEDRGGKVVLFDAATQAAVGEMKKGPRDTGEVKGFFVLEGSLLLTTSFSLFSAPLVGKPVVSVLPHEDISGNGRPAIHGERILLGTSWGASVFAATGEEQARLTGVEPDRAVFAADGRSVLVHADGQLSEWRLP